MSAKGKISLGILNTSKIGLIKDKIKSKTPLFINKLTASIIAIKVGKRFVIIEKLSFTPSMNVSYTSTFLKNTYSIIKSTTTGIIKLDIKLIFIPPS